MKKYKTILIIFGAAISTILLAIFLESVLPKVPIIERKYQVRLSNFIGSDYYKCDSVIWIDSQHFKLINKEDSEPFIEIVVPEDVTVRIKKY